MKTLIQGHTKIDVEGDVKKVFINIEGTWHRMIKGDAADMTKVREPKFPVLWRQEGAKLVFYPASANEEKIRVEYEDGDT